MSEVSEAEVQAAESSKPVEVGELIVDDDRTIYQRMVAILDELPAIGKTQENSQQHFMFRGHDDVLNALNPLLAKHGVVVVPDVRKRKTAERTTGQNKTMYEVNLWVRFTFYGADGTSIVSSAWGEGTDMGDKATSKAHTMAFKTVLAQAFAVSTKEGFDPDAQSDEPTTRGTGSGGRRSAPQPRAAAGPSKVQANSWTEWSKLMSDYGVTPEESTEWLRQAAFAIHLDRADPALFTRANKVLAKLADTNDGKGVALVEGARGLTAIAFAAGFDGQVVPGPEWRLDPSEEDKLTYDEWFLAQQPQEGTPEAATEDIPFGEAPASRPLSTPMALPRRMMERAHHERRADRGHPADAAEERD